ncbi:protein NRT1/ PTR FAMILY 6.2-like [Macadamia integrifolia]|uniref:protein NRT1/ PTR FAMILY 6.2-like n=1 Tax=Macadamia integrifolia TaxID=60698 RepID=UPI001C4E6C10|nr:protein NRT1/ PTR FAMILY 6.2-like [Macadamia integrifolia]
MGIAANLVTYSTGTLYLPSAIAAKIVSDFFGAGYLLCLVGSFVADSFLGRYWTIAISAMIIAVVSAAILSISCAMPSLQPPPCLLNSSTCIPANGLQVGILNLALYVIAIGQGGLKANVSGFGTDQFDENDNKEKTKMDYFFRRFYFCISLGTILSVTLGIGVQDYVTGTQVGTGWLTSNINYGKLYYFYALLAVLSFINLIFYILCALWYVRTMKNATQIESIVTSSDEEEKHDMQMKGTLTTSAEED